MNQLLRTIVSLATMLATLLASSSAFAVNAPEQHTSTLTRTETATTEAVADTQDPTEEPSQIAVLEAPATEYIHRTIEVDDQDYNWTIMIPPTAEKGGPGLLFLHGLGAGGTQGKAHIRYGLVPAIAKDPGSWPFVVIIPQKTSSSAWDFHEEAVMKMIDVAIEEGYIDQDKIGITGLSQGGRGSMVFAANHPERFAAIAPVCGYAQIAYDENGTRTPPPSMVEYQAAMMGLSEKLKDRPMWLFHGADDRVVPAATSRIMNMTLKSMEADVSYTEFPDTDHNAWDSAYAMSELGEWFSKHLNK